MESTGSAVVDFGRFCTGFLVVMGVGTCFSSSESGGVEPAQVWGCVSVYRGRSVLMCLFSTALPVLLAHCGMIAIPAMAMSIIGGLLIYGTIISFTMFFHEEQDF